MRDSLIIGVFVAIVAILAGVAYVVATAATAYFQADADKDVANTNVFGQVETTTAVQAGRTARNQVDEEQKTERAKTAWQTIGSVATTIVGMLV